MHGFLLGIGRSPSRRPRPPAMDSRGSHGVRGPMRRPRILPGAHPVVAGVVLDLGAVALLLATSMRDFAIAAGLAAAAFGPAAAAPLGLYGILVLVWGTAAAGFLRKRPDRRRDG